MLELPDSGILKRCIRCRVEHPLADFYTDKRSEDGKANYCRASRQLRLKKYYFRHPEAYNKGRVVKSQRNDDKVLRESLLTEDRRRLGKRAVRALLASGMSVKELAAQVEVTPRAVRSWSTGMRVPYPAHLETLLGLAKLRLSDLGLCMYRERLASNAPLSRPPIRDQDVAHRRAAKYRRLASRPDDCAPSWKWIEAKEEITA